uniref:Uncharacterized protein n=1 Tax=Tetraselmis sp. GSL018 TaxID=582737 RepID=A0A061S7L2_9CHLO|mmetsp:Transcript_22582/g.54047  ORF Transcript_22582/g.54047 Transcript_22582/m.54047 type:complete len:832 (-) Transcript_22582:309-2804(-)|eukprot:CAMPEP_0177601100 /NCGR_PEP_ID=MMETSP0419_2-20121207/14046_1 /TAXON_ID=582737 /ORGANISM="Tetraselmis sp., Strain GSL018" /LENGTH=831 /DNA_ID=CAMNT_0019094277 /DNA_START=161 /DNA_END=2656 /DNA_ORIENTATION=-
MAPYSGKRMSVARKKSPKTFPAPPRHCADVNELEDYMGLVWLMPLKTSLKALSTCEGLEVSHALGLMGRYLLGEGSAVSEIRRRLKEDRAAPHEGGMAAALLALPLERCVETTMKGRIAWEPDDDPCRRLAESLLEEAQRQRLSEPTGAIIPTVPPQEKSSVYEFPHNVSDAAHRCQDAVASGSLPQLMGMQLDASDLRKSVESTASLVEKECESLSGVCAEVAQMMLAAVKKQRQQKGALDDSDREVVAGTLGAVRSIVADAGSAIASTLQGMIEQAKGLGAELLDESTAQELDASGDAKRTLEGIVERLQELCSMAEETLETAVSSMEGSVEYVLFDSGADIVAQIAVEERAVVQSLGISPWQVKLSAAQRRLVEGIQSIVSKLTATRPAAGNGEAGPSPVSERGQMSQQRALPCFEVLTLLVSAVARCLGDSERAIGIGLQPGAREDLELLDSSQAQDPEAAEPGDKGPGASFRAAAAAMREAALGVLQEGVGRVAQAAGWGAPGEWESAAPATLLARQTRIAGIIQRLQSRLMLSVEASCRLATVMWDPDSLEVLTRGRATGMPLAVREYASVVPFLREVQSLHSLLESTKLRGGSGYPYELITASELERCCKHLTQEVEGFAATRPMAAAAEDTNEQETQPGAGSTNVQGPTDVDPGIGKDFPPAGQQKGQGPEDVDSAETGAPHEADTSATTEISPGQEASPGDVDSEKEEGPPVGSQGTKADGEGNGASPVLEGFTGFGQNDNDGSSVRLGSPSLHLNDESCTEHEQPDTNDLHRAASAHGENQDSILAEGPATAPAQEVMHEIEGVLEMVGNLVASLKQAALV